MTSVANFDPDWASPPGDTISDLIEERGWTQVELAGRLGYTTKHVSQLVNGKATVTEDTALRLERVLGGAAPFWLTREAQYRAQAAHLAARASLGDWAEWADRFPVSELVRVGAIAPRETDAGVKAEIVEALLRFFSVASPAEWTKKYAAMELAYRRARQDQLDVEAISAWLRLGEIASEKLDPRPYDRARFESLLRELGGHSPDDHRLTAVCYDAGVALAVVPSIPQARVTSAARWLGSHRPLIQLSLELRANDRFWPAFFHGAAHLLLHSRKELFLDDVGSNQHVLSVVEEEAEAWAATLLPSTAGRP